MARAAYRSVCCVVGIALFPFCLHAQFQIYGLSGYPVHHLSNFWNGKIYAATERGVFTRPVQGSDTIWTLIGLEGMSVRAVYPHNIGPLGYAITAGIEWMPGQTDSAVIYCSRYSDMNWLPADSGINRADVNSIRTINGFPSPAICGETFTGGGGKVYVRSSDVWNEVFDIGIGVVNVVTVDPRNVTVWVGGETAIFAPFIAHSTDKGATWTNTFPDLAGDNACNSLAFDPIDTSVVYAGMEGSVIKSTDGGMAWFITTLQGTPYYFYGLAYDSFTGSLFAGGTTSGGDPGLFVSRDHGSTWNPVALPAECDGILCMTIIPTMIPEEHILLMGTLTAGVIGYRIPLTSVEDPAAPQQISLKQNYPNPFNPTTTIRYTVGGIRGQGLGISQVRLVVYDLLGREVAVLVNERKPPGSYEVRFDASALVSGVYMYCLKAGRYVESRTMLLLR
jgi:hypothetical protein